MDNNLKNFGKLIRKKRNLLALSLEQLAEICDLSVRGLIKIEHGESNIRLVNLLRLCTALDIDCGELQQFYSDPYSDYEESDIVDIKFILK